MSGVAKVSVAMNGRMPLSKPGRRKLNTEPWNSEMYAPETESQMALKVSAGREKKYPAAALHALVGERR